MENTRDECKGTNGNGCSLSVVQGNSMKSRKIDTRDAVVGAFIGFMPMAAIYVEHLRVYIQPLLLLMYLDESRVVV